MHLGVFEGLFLWVEMGVGEVLLGHIFFGSEWVYLGLFRSPIPNTLFFSLLVLCLRLVAVSASESVIGLMSVPMSASE